MIAVKKAVRGYVDAQGNAYSEKEVVFNRRMFTVEGEVKKAKKVSRSSYTPSNTWRGSQVRGEMAYFSQAEKRGKATVELVMRKNEVAI